MPFENEPKLTFDRIAAYNSDFVGNPELVRMQNAVTRVSVDEVALRHERVVSLPTSMSNRLDDWTVTDQKKSGRCWLFAALNLFRYGTAKKLGVKQFEFSQNHAMYWDKLERANMFLGDIIETADEPVDGRLVSFLLETLLGDGGQWNMAMSVFLKHGVVPKEAMPETQSSSDTDRMNKSLCSVLRQGAKALRDAIGQGASAEQIDALRNDYVAASHRILTIHLGTPPTDFDWQWTDDAKEFHRAGRITPQQFFAEYVTIPVEHFVCLVDDPRPEHPKGSLLTVEHLGNVVGGEPVIYVNSRIDQMKQLAAAAIVAGEPVWFGCDVGQQMQRTEGIWSADLFDVGGVYATDFTMDKEARVRYGDSLMTHAMLLTGVDLVDGVPRRWRVENSWGDKNGDKGFYTMDDSWFDEYVFEVAVDARKLPDDLAAALGTEPISLAPWDPMGALAAR